MTVGMIIGLILLPFAWMFMAAVKKQHREETGVDAPTRAASRTIRRNARKKGISEAEAYEQWLARKQRLADPTRPKRPRRTKSTNSKPSGL